MDTLTHAVLGATTGEVLMGKQLGRRAAIYGAVLQNIPDLDGVAGLWLSPDANLWAHRGITHSLLFAVMMGTILGLTAAWHHRKESIPTGHLVAFAMLQLLIHSVLDTCNAYGVGWWEPFHNNRISWHLLYVADPFFTFPLLVGALYVLLSRKSAARPKVAWVSLALMVVYLLQALIGKSVVAQQAAAQLGAKPLLLTPAPFNTWLWYVVATDSAGYRTGYASVADQPQSLKLTYKPANTHWLPLAPNATEANRLVAFADAIYTIEKYGNELYLQIPRFGQVTGWYDGTQPFVFRYHLGGPVSENRLVMQRGRFENWNQHTSRALLARIRGKAVIRADGNRK